jgi:uncharacterized protein YjiS (DUF1127 family)
MNAVRAELVPRRLRGRTPLPVAGHAARLARWREAFARWRERRRSRQMLLTLDDRTLRDIGLTRLDAWQEWKKPFWRP